MFFIRDFEIPLRASRGLWILTYSMVPISVWPFETTLSFFRPVTISISSISIEYLGPIVSGTRITALPEPKSLPQANWSVAFGDESLSIEQTQIQLGIGPMESIFGSEKSADHSSAGSTFNRYVKSRARWHSIPRDRKRKENLLLPPRIVVFGSKTWFEHCIGNGTHLQMD